MANILLFDKHEREGSNIKNVIPNMWFKDNFRKQAKSVSSYHLLEIGR